jgi:hypothetical protein
MGWPISVRSEAAASAKLSLTGLKRRPGSPLVLIDFDGEIGARIPRPDPRIFGGLVKQFVGATPADLPVQAPTK